MQRYASYRLRHFGTIPACDRRTDGQTDNRPQHTWRYTQALHIARTTVSLSADAVDPRDVVSRPIDHRAVHRAGRRVRSTADNRRRL